jgi:hypothetical protein
MLFMSVSTGVFARDGFTVVALVDSGPRGSAGVGETSSPERDGGIVSRPPAFHPGTRPGPIPPTHHPIDSSCRFQRDRLAPITVSGLSQHYPYSPTQPETRRQPASAPPAPRSTRAAGASFPLSRAAEPMSRVSHQGPDAALLDALTATRDYALLNQRSGVAKDRGVAARIARLGAGMIVEGRTMDQTRLMKDQIAVDTARKLGPVVDRARSRGCSSELDLRKCYQKIFGGRPGLPLGPSAFGISGVQVIGTIGIGIGVGIDISNGIG